MSKKRYLIAGLIFLSLLLTFTFSITMLTDNQPSKAADLPNEQTNSSYHYLQLDEQSKKFYNAMETLNTSGELKTGNGSLDLVSTGAISTEQLSAFIGGDPNLKASFQNARDAFEKDRYEIFYIDFTKLTLRIGKIGGNYVAYLNSGINPNYYAKGFSSVADVDTAVALTNENINVIVDKIKELEKGSVLSVDKIANAAHNYLIEDLEYSYASDTRPFVAGLNAINDGYANCVGYAYLFKAIMDKFNIENILVTGAAINSQDITEEHMWNYLKIDNTWFGMDVTWDDPIIKNPNIPLTTKYLLKGSDEFEISHFPSGVFSPNGKTFDYPALNDVSFEYYMTTKLEDTTTDIKVYTTKYYDKDLVEHTNLIMSYKNLSINELKKQGLYFAVRFAFGGKNFEPWSPLDVFYQDLNQLFYSFQISKMGSVQYCVTNLDFKSNSSHSIGNGLIYNVDLSLSGKHIEISTPLRLPYYDTYVAPPFVRTAIPSLGKRIKPEKTHYVIEFDDELVLKDAALPIGISVSSPENLGYTLENLKMSYSNFTLPTGLNRKSTLIEFDFTPANIYQVYINTYSLQLTNLKGIISGKDPNAFPINVIFETKVPCPSFVAKGSIADAFAIALPTLVVNDSLDIFDYDGKSDVANPLDIRLVASVPTQKDQNNIIEASGESQVLSSSVYDLSLSCRGELVKLKSETQYNVTIGLPYPPGYNYNDNKDVTFKAYHYRKQADGTYLTEELVCRISEKGLEILANDFSPFAIVAVPKLSNTPASENRFISVEVKTSGGDILLKDSPISGVGIHSLNSSAFEKSFTIKCDTGYEIQKIIVNGESVSIVNNEITFKYATMKNDNVLQVYFVNQIVKLKDAEIGFEAIQPKISLQKYHIDLPDLVFASKTFQFNESDPKKAYSLSIDNLPQGYKVVYSDNNSASEIGKYIINATIYKLAQDGTIDDSYYPFKLSAEMIIEEVKVSSSSLSKMLPIILMGSIAVLFIGAMVIVVLKRH